MSTALERRDDDVRQRLDRRRRVDIIDDGVAGILLQPFGIQVGRAAVGKRAAGVQVGQQDQLVRVDNLGGLGHEVDAAEDDHVGIGLRRRLRQRQAVADMVGQILNLGVLIVMRQNDGVQLLFKPPISDSRSSFGSIVSSLRGQIRFLSQTFRGRIARRVRQRQRFHDMIIIPHRALSAGGTPGYNLRMPRRIWAIADPHLSFSQPKPMDIFGEHWRDHPARIEKNCRAVVEPLICC